MLSAQAFNAFLKTLEEPPAHAIFILATTEKHKIIPTILSRCQIYDFNRIRTEDTVGYLKYIAGEEKVSFEDDALHVIAQKAEGAMRDALSIFDQVVSFSENKITYDIVIENLNILNVEYYFKMSKDFLNNNLSSALLTFNEILNKGFDSRNFMSGLASHFRDVLVSKNPETTILLDVGANLKDQYLKQAAEVPVEFLYDALEICNTADLQFRGSKNQRLTIELAIVKLSNLTMVQKKKITEQKSAPPVIGKENKQLEKEHVAIKIPASAKEDNESDKSDAEVKLEQKAATEKSANGNGRENQVVHTKSFSIKGVLKGAVRDIPVEDKEIDEVDQVSKEFEKTALVPVEITETVIQKAWETYANSLENSQPRIYSTLKQHKPTLGEQGKIFIHLNSNAQRENFIQNIKPGLTRYFQKNLANIEYVFETNLIANETTVKKVYTDHDKLEYMINKNKELEKLKTRFNLDFDN
jgi:DNA polymerase-3 subunit gamma/tau